MPDSTAKNNVRIPIVEFLNKIIVNVVETVAWLNVVLILVVLLQVIMRYGFNRGQVPLEELMWHLYAVVFMFGMAYAITKDSHIRVDIIHMMLPERVKHIFEILGILFLLLPTILVLLYHSTDWVAESYRVGESSENPTGLPFRWAIKAVLPLSMIFMLIASISRLIEKFVILLRLKKEPAGHNSS
jgi:TRAP-type mannitol/chloroaromatic compound transport system permease small subunit